MQRPYHHGDLRRALLDETFRRIDLDGVDSFSLRGVAEAVGVSPMAVYRHFPDREGLLRATAAEALEQLGLELEAAVARRRSPATRLRALLLAYLDAAVGRPHRFRLMFGPMGAGHPDGVLDAAAAGPRPQQLFITIATELLRARPRSHTDATSLAATLWASVHGLAILVIDGPIDAALARDLVERLAAAPPLLLPPA
jgi:AcrR family transcriptional regulator